MELLSIAGEWMWIMEIFISMSRGTFKPQLNIYDGAFLQNYIHIYILSH